MPVIGFLKVHAGRPGFAHLVAASEQGLQRAGLCRGPERRHRVSLGGRSTTIGCWCWRPILLSQQRGRDRRSSGTEAALAAKAASHDHADRICNRCRSGRRPAWSPASTDPAATLRVSCLYLSSLAAKRLELLREVRSARLSSSRVLREPEFSVTAEINSRETAGSGDVPSIRISTLSMPRHERDSTCAFAAVRAGRRAFACRSFRLAILHWQRRANRRRWRLRHAVPAIV